MAKSIDEVIAEIGTPTELTEEQVQRIIATGVSHNLFNGNTSRKIIFAFRGKVYARERTPDAKYILLSPIEDDRGY
jgi:hypothetical protein